MKKEQFNKILNRLSQSQISGPTLDLEDECEFCKNKIGECLSKLGYTEEPCDAIKRAMQELNEIQRSFRSAQDHCTEKCKSSGTDEFYSCTMGDICAFFNHGEDGMSSKEKCCSKCMLKAGTSLGDATRVAKLFCGIFGDCMGFLNSDPTNRNCYRSMTEGNCCKKNPQVIFNK